jgi:hypothetical protein
VDTELRKIFSWVADKFCSFLKNKLCLLLFEDIAEVAVRHANLKPFSAATAYVERKWVISTIAIAWRMSVGDYCFLG